MPDSQTLVARLVELRTPGRAATDEEQRRYSKLPAQELERMVASLERGSELARIKRRVAPNDQVVRRALVERKTRALAKLDAVADRIAARKPLPAPTLAKQVNKANESETVSVIDNDARLKRVREVLLRKDHSSIYKSIALHSMLDVYTGVWEKPAIDKLADAIIRDEPGNLIPAIEAELGAENFDALINKSDAVERYLEFALRKARWGVVRLLDKELLAGARQGQAMKELLSDPTLRSSVFEPAFLTDVRPMLTVAGATEALAKMYLFGDDFRPTRIVSVGKGGAIVGHFLRSELKMDYRRFYSFEPRRDNYLQFAMSTSESDRILIVSDIAEDANSVISLRRNLEARMPATSIAYCALVGRAASYDSYRGSSLTYFANLTGENDALVPWDRAGTYHRTAASHFFGHSQRTLPTFIPFLRIAKDFFASVTNGLLAMVK